MAVNEHIDIPVPHWKQTKGIGRQSIMVEVGAWSRELASRKEIKFNQKDD